MSTHISARLDWHDRGWDGHVCDDPAANTFCIGNSHIRNCLKRKPNLDFEKANHGRSIPEIQQQPECKNWQPACSRVPGAFGKVMWQFEHPRDGTTEPADSSVFVDTSRNHPDGKLWKDVVCERSLVFFYCNSNSPLADDAGTEPTSEKFLVGVGTISKIGQPVAGVRRIQHNGFRLPYQEYLSHQKDIAGILCRVPAYARAQFTYTCEQVTDDVAIPLLELLLASFRQVAVDGTVSGDWDKAIKAVKELLNRVWRDRGPFPGLGAVLEHLGWRDGPAYHREVLSKIAEDGGNPWQAVENILEGTSAADQQYNNGVSNAVGKWKCMATDHRSLAKVLSRFGFSKDICDQLMDADVRAGRGIAGTDEAITRNPYLVCEQDRGDNDGICVSFGSIDRGLCPSDESQRNYLVNHALDIAQADDKRRVRAATASALEDAAKNGHTIVPLKVLAKQLKGPLPPLPQFDQLQSLFGDDSKYFNEMLHFPAKTGDEKDMAFLSLKFLAECESFIASNVEARFRTETAANAKRIDWQAVARKELEEKQEVKLDEAQIQALHTTYTSPFSILTGRAGTGKTFIIRTLLAQLRQENKSTLVVAPTGKATLLLNSDGKTQAVTIHSHLTKNNWLFKENFALRPTGGQRSRVSTLIVDECSMVPTDLLATLIKSIEPDSVERIILVGDPNQLPPIGPGKPFVDILNELTARGISQTDVAELKIIHRHQSVHAAKLAELFRGMGSAENGACAGDIIAGAENAADSDLKVAFWANHGALDGLILQTIDKMLPQCGPDWKRMNAAIGADDKSPRPELAESWQILCPTRKFRHGADQLNRVIQQKYRGGIIGAVRIGNQPLTKTDKVIQTRNLRRNGSLIANGEIGILVKAIGDKGIGGASIAFSTQPNKQQNYSAQDADQYLELAYALTVHKAQGSGFGKVIFVLPKHCGNLSREMIYTALTRFRENITLLLEGDHARLCDLAQNGPSETARRSTNLFRLLIGAEHACAVPGKALA